VKQKQQWQHWSCRISNHDPVYAGMLIRDGWCHFFDSASAPPRKRFAPHPLLRKS